MAFSTGAFSDGNTVFIWKMIQRWLITLEYGITNLKALWVLNNNINFE